MSLSDDWYWPKVRVLEFELNGRFNFSKNQQTMPTLQNGTRDTFEKQRIGKKIKEQQRTRKCLSKLYL